MSRRCVALAILVVTTLVSACSSVGGTPAPSLEPPLSLSDCNWPNDTELAFEGWATEATLGMEQHSASGGQLYWLISAQPVRVVTTQGEYMARVACSLEDNGTRIWAVIPDDWTPPPVPAS